MDIEKPAGGKEQAPSDFERVFQATIRGNMRVPQIATGIYTYMLQAIFSSPDPRATLTEYLTRTPSEEELAHLSKLGTDAHTAFRVGKAVGKEEFIPRTVTLVQVRTLLEREKVGIERFVVSLFEVLTKKQMGRKEVLNAIKEGPLPIDVFNACLTAGLTLIEKDPEMIEMLKKYRKNFSHLTFASEYTEPVLTSQQLELKRKISRAIAGAMETASQGYTGTDAEAAKELVNLLKRII